MKNITSRLANSNNINCFIKRNKIKVLKFKSQFSHKFCHLMCILNFTCL